MRITIFYVLLLFFVYNNVILAYKSPYNTTNFQSNIPERKKNGLIAIPPLEWDTFPSTITFRDTVIYNPAYLPVVFDGKILPENLDFLPKDTITQGFQLHLVPRDSTFAPLIDQLDHVQTQRRDFYMNMSNVKNVRYSLAQLKAIPKIDERKVIKHNLLQQIVVPEGPPEISPLEIEQIQPAFKYWFKSGEHLLQVAQNYISDNWYNGGNSSFFVRNYHKILLNYKKNKLTFNNTFEWKLSLQQTPADTLHKINFSEDLVRLENTFGYEAFKHWSYSAKLESKTPLFNSYPVNSAEKNTGLFAPLTINLGLGMSYTLDKSYENNITKKLKLTQNIAPFSINYVYVANTGVDVTRFGVEAGKRSKLEIGSLINTDLSYTFNKFTSWTSRFKYFTNYQRAEIEFENKFNMSLNRYLSTNVSFYLRYDDNIPKGDQLGYFQINEIVSFGLSYKW